MIAAPGLYFEMHPGHLYGDASFPGEVSDMEDVPPLLCNNRKEPGKGGEFIR